MIAPLQRWRVRALGLLLLGCASTQPEVHLDIQGQIVGSSVRELIIRARNEAPENEDLHLEVTIPNRLHLPSAMTTGTMTTKRVTRGEEATSFHFVQRGVEPGAIALARVAVANMPGEIVVATLTERHRRRLIERRSLTLTR